MSLPSILIIEDNAAETDLLKFAFDSQGEKYELLVLTDGEQALQFVKEHRTGIRRPDPCVIVLDLHLPKVEGIAILQEISRTPIMRHIKVVVLTGGANPAEKEVIAQYGVYYREKPTSLDRYMKIGAEIFELCKGAAAATAL